MEETTTDMEAQIRQYRAEALAHIESAMPAIREQGVGAALALLATLRRWMTYDWEACAAITDAARAGNADRVQSLLLRGVERNFD